MMSERVKIWGGRTARWSILGTLTIFLAFPFVWMLITMSSIVSTVRSAVLNGVLSGTRSMPNLICVIFMSPHVRWSSRFGSGR